ncbi:ATP-binding protein [[Mycobacterium] appelbergii]|uniref:ATP-binding protein n=1 Tax=[Mycobacterium] appelbergii TaxID=2939269 RepID=UPI002938FA3F|nr:anti-sigma factor [Mycobacterium sp. 21AC1]
MAEAMGQHNMPTRGARAVELRVAAELENLAVLRTLVGAIATFEDFDFDVVADLRLAVDEACTTLIRAADPDSTLVLVVDPHDDALAISASTTCHDSAGIEPGTFSWHVLSSLTDEVSTFTNGVGPEERRVMGISLMTRRASLLQ